MKLREKTTAILLIAIIMVSTMAFVSRATSAQDNPTITPDPTYGPPGTTVVIEGAHFIAMENVTLEFWNEEMTVKYQNIGTVETDSEGDFSCTFIVGPVDFGTYIINATQEDYQIIAIVYFDVRAPRISGVVYYSITPLVGVQIDLGQGWVKNDPLVTTTTDSDGYYCFSSVVPGVYWVKAWGPTTEYIKWIAKTNLQIYEDKTQDIDVAKLMTLLSPENGADVASLHPTLTWEANPEADNYWVQVNVNDGWELVEHEMSVSTEYTISAQLSPGVEYAWQVDAYDAVGHWVGTTQTAYLFNLALVRSDLVPGKGKGLDKPLPNDNFAKGRNK